MIWSTLPLKSSPPHSATCPHPAHTVSNLWSFLVRNLTGLARPFSVLVYVRAFGHDLGFGRRWMLTAETEEGVKRGHRRVSSGVTDDELVEVDLQMLSAHAAVGAAEPGGPIRGLE